MGKLVLKDIRGKVDTFCGKLPQFSFLKYEEKELPESSG